MISSPILAQPPHMTSSPSASPTLRPVRGVMADDERSRRTARPYCSPRLQRSRSRPRGQVDEETSAFAQSIASIVRARKGRAAELGISPTVSSSPGREPEPLLELVVDVPVWSAGCFADLSTLHALRDTTLQRVHLLIGHLNDTYAIQASYKLLARRPTAIGWGAIRVSPSQLDGPMTRPVRRTSFVRPEREGSGGVASPPRRLSHGQRPPSLSFDNAIHSDSESDADHSDDAAYDEDDDEKDTDEIIRAEHQRRGGKEGISWITTLKGQLMLVLV